MQSRPGRLSPPQHDPIFQLNLPVQFISSTAYQPFQSQREWPYDRSLQRRLLVSQSAGDIDYLCLHPSLIRRLAMAERKKYLNEEDFKAGLVALDKEMGQNPWLVAFAPIRIVTAGGFLAVSYLRNREATGDIDYLIDPIYVGDGDINKALHAAIESVGDRLKFNDEWFNDDISIFVTKRARENVFERADKQGITLFKGENLEVLAAPIEWALERKLRRIYAGDRDRKAETDMADAVALLKKLKERTNEPLDLELIRTMNTNGFDVCPDHDTMHRVANVYRDEYKEEPFK